MSRGLCCVLFAVSLPDESLLGGPRLEAIYKGGGGCIVSDTQSEAEPCTRMRMFYSLMDGGWAVGGGYRGDAATRKINKPLFFFVVI